MENQPQPAQEETIEQIVAKAEVKDLEFKRTVNEELNKLFGGVEVMSFKHVEGSYYVEFKVKDTQEVQTVTVKK